MVETPDAALDNDVLIKLAAYDLLIQARAQLGAVGVLGAAKFVVRDALDRHRGLQDPVAARARWESSLGELHFLEPTDDEVALATFLEEHAAFEGLPLDSGESQLCAIAISRGIGLLVTGDKRAIAAAEAIAQTATQLLELAGRFVCLEQLASRLIAELGAGEVRSRICAEPGADKALAICLSCSSFAAGAAFDPGGLVSYVEHLRADAPTLLSTHSP